MSIVFRSAASNRTASDSGSTSLTIARPAGVVSGDMLIGVFSVNQDYVITPPSGWTLILATNTGNNRVEVYRKLAGSSEPTSYTFSVPTTNYLEGIVAAYTGVHPTEPIDVSAGQGFDSGTNIVAPSVTTTAPNTTVLSIFSTRSGATLTTPSGTTQRAYVTVGGGYPALKLADKPQATVGATGTATSTSGASSQAAAQHVALRSANQAPNAPTLTSMHDGSVIDRAAANRASHAFSDPDLGDSQSAFDHRYRLIGAATWTTGYEPVPNQYVDYPAGTFAAGDYERQVRTYDAQGVAGPWSPSGYFTAADGPADPTITDPIQNETISSETRDITWSAPQQDAYQLQVLDGGLVEHDTGTKVTTSRTAYGVPYPTNNVTRTTRVRVRHGGLWSDWYSVSNPVSYTQPALPVVTLTPAGTGLLVQVANPIPATGEPTVTHNEVWVDDGGGETRRVAALAANGSWTYALPRSGRNYDGAVRAVAVGDNGTTRSSS